MASFWRRIADFIVSTGKFGIVGVLTAGIFFSAMYMFDSFLGLNYLVCTSLAYVLSTSFHFFANKYFTFGNRQTIVLGQVVRYLIVWVLNYLITISIVRLGVEKMKLSPYLGVCCSVAITVFIGYFLSRYWIFKAKDETV
jgi:putative flippase GtrA